LGSEIFRKITGTYLEAQSSHLIDTFHRQQTHLPMGTAVSMGIADKAVVLFKNTFGYSFLSGTLLFALTDGNYFSH
jgi:hypothetical protein